MQLHLEVRRLFEYRDGKLVYKEAPPFKPQLLGKEAGCNANGYVIIGIKGKQYPRSRLVYIWHNGEIDDDLVVDHINRNTYDDRIENLRLANKSQNAANSVAHSHRNLPKGVYAYKGRYKAVIKSNGATMHIGVYDTPDEASNAYMQEAKAIHGEFARK